MTPEQREAVFFGVIALGFLAWLLPGLPSELKTLSWRKRLSNGGLWSALAILAFVLGSAGVFWNPLAVGFNYLAFAVIAVFVIGWIWLLGWAGFDLVKRPRERILALLYFAVVGGLIAARLLDATRVRWSFVVGVASVGSLVMFGLNDYLGSKERKEATVKRMEDEVVKKRPGKT
jgi:hypothetical protein